jgi:hypothetical protein
MGVVCGLLTWWRGRLWVGAAAESGPGHPASGVRAAGERGDRTPGDQLKNRDGNNRHDERRNGQQCDPFPGQHGQPPPPPWAVGSWLLGAPFQGGTRLAKLIIGEMQMALGRSTVAP